MWLVEFVRRIGRSNLLRRSFRMRCCSDRDQPDSFAVPTTATCRLETNPRSKSAAQRLFFVALAGPQHELLLVRPAISTLVGELLAVGRPPRVPA